MLSCCWRSCHCVTTWWKKRSQKIVLKFSNILAASSSSRLSQMNPQRLSVASPFFHELVIISNTILWCLITSLWKMTKTIIKIFYSSGSAPPARTLARVSRSLLPRCPDPPGQPPPFCCMGIYLSLPRYSPPGLSPPLARAPQRGCLPLQHHQEQHLYTVIIVS